MVQPSSNLTSQDSYFNWICYATAVVFGVAVLALIYGLKSEVTVSLDSAQMAITEANQAIGIVNEKLPDIVAAVNRGSETLSGLAEDVELIKSVAGIRGDQTDQGFRSLLNYADEIQKAVLVIAFHQRRQQPRAPLSPFRYSNAGDYEYDRERQT